MSEENFEHFRQIVLQDLALQEQLREITDRSLFIRRVVELGAERGYEIAVEDVERAMHANRRALTERWI